MRKLLVLLLIAGFAVAFYSCKKAEEKITPVSCFTISPAEMHTGDVITFNSSCTENGDTFEWNFGDGGSSTDVSPSHTFNTAGDFTVTLTVTSVSGISHSSNQTVTVAGMPGACFTYTPATEIQINDNVSFDASCATNATTFSWNFGDGSTETGITTTHAFATAGNFKVILEIKDESGLADTVSQVLVINSLVTTHSGNIDANETWGEGVHEITGDIYVNSATLTIAPGAIIKFDQGTGLYIGYSGGSAGATLIADGTAEKPILFTSAASTPAAGDWYDISFYSGSSSNSSMKYCTVQYGGGYANYKGEINIDDTKVTIENSIIELSEYNGIVLNNAGSFKSFVSNTIRQTPTNPIQMNGNFVHTIGANNVFTTETGILVIANTFDQANATWRKLTCPYIIDGSLRIENTTLAKLTLEPGVRLMFTQGSELLVGYGSNEFGALIAKGTATDSIYFTSAAPEGSKTPGDWYGLGFYKGAGSNSVMSRCVVEYGGGYASYLGELYVKESSLKIDSSTIRNSASYGINLDNTSKFGSFTNNVVTGNATYPLNIFANYTHTIGTGNTFDAPGILVYGAVVGATVTWLNQGVPYIIDGTLRVESTSGNTLTIEPGIVIEFTNDSELNVGYSGSGTLVAQGTAESPITFTSAAPEGNKSAGDWYGISFYGGAGANTILDYCIISYGGGYASYTGNITIHNSLAGRPTISNCTITDSIAYGIFMQNGDTPTLSGNTFINNALGDTN